MALVVIVRSLVKTSPTVGLSLTAIVTGYPATGLNADPLI